MDDDRSSGSVKDVYTNTDVDYYPGARERSRPGTHPSDQQYDIVIDDKGRKYPNKPSNKPFLKSKAQREAHAKRVAEDARRRASQPSSGITLTRLILFLLFLPLLSQFTTKSWTFNTSKHFVPPLRKYWSTHAWNPNRVKLRQFTLEKLSRFDGSDPRRPLYLAIDGDVYDVTTNRRVYGPGGSYNFMTGKDASRAFITGCFETHQTHDLRGLTAEQLKALDHWKSFFARHDSYTYVGRVSLPEIDPSSPIPPPCRDEEGNEIPAGGTGAGPHGPKPVPVESHGQQTGHARVTGEL